MPHTSESLLTRGVAEVIDHNHLRQRLEKGDHLRVKLGIDPSTPYLHLGHAVPLRKLREFQDAGHTAVLIIGDYTAQIGDPSGKSESRNMLTAEETKQNAEDYLDQAYTLLDKTKTEVHFQSEWFHDFSLRQVIELMASTTVSHILSHETFGERLKANLPLRMHEFLYPLMQGYDSVMVKADVELGGIDQKFNVLMGRVLQRAHHQPEQDVMLFPYLPGIDGQAKMSKSLGNTINLTDTPEVMFAKVMSIPDTLIETYFQLATLVPTNKLEVVKEELKDPTTNPRDIKMQLAETIVAEQYAPANAKTAKTGWQKQFQQKQIPDDIETLLLSPQTYDLSQVLVSRTTLVPSKSEFRRLIAQRGIKKNNRVVTNLDETVSPTDGQEVVIHIGSRRFLKVRWK